MTGDIGAIFPQRNLGVFIINSRIISIYSLPRILKDGRRANANSKRS